MSSLPIYTIVSGLATVLTVTLALGRSDPVPEQGAALFLLKIVFADKICVLLLVNLTYTLLLWVAKLIQYIFFGLLRPVESQHMYDRLLNYLMFKIMFVGAILEPDMYELIVWTTWFSILGFLRVFSMLARDRFDFVTASPTTPSSVHGRLLFLLISIQILNLSWLGLCVYIFSEAGVSVLLLLVFECATLFLDTLQTILKYCIHLYDLQHTGVWERRNSLLYHTEIITDLAVQIATLLHYVHVLTLHGINFTLIDAVLFLNIRTEFKQFRKRLAGYRNYFIANRSLNTKYPDLHLSLHNDVTAEQLKAYDDHCAICRDDMLNAKQLPCKHMFHASCLRSWLEHHGSCPTCRTSLIDEGVPSASDRANASVLASRNRTSVNATNTTTNVRDTMHDANGGPGVPRPLSMGLEATRSMSLPHPALDSSDSGRDTSESARVNYTSWASDRGNDRRVGNDLRRRGRGGDVAQNDADLASHSSDMNVHLRSRESMSMSGEGSSSSGSRTGTGLPRLQQVSDAFSRLPPLAFNQSNNLHSQTRPPAPQSIHTGPDGSVHVQARARTASPPLTNSRTDVNPPINTHILPHTRARGARGGVHTAARDGSALARLSRWLEQLSVSFTATPRLSEEELQGMMEGVLEVFPQANRQAVVADLRRTGSVVQTINNVLTWPPNMMEDRPTPAPVQTTASAQPLAPSESATSSRNTTPLNTSTASHIHPNQDNSNINPQVSSDTQNRHTMDGADTGTSYPVGTYHNQRTFAGSRNISLDADASSNPSSVHRNDFHNQNESSSGTAVQLSPRTELGSQSSVPEPSSHDIMTSTSTSTTHHSSHDLTDQLTTTSTTVYNNNLGHAQLHTQPTSHSDRAASTDTDTSSGTSMNNRRLSFTDSELSRHINVFRSSQSRNQPPPRRPGGVALNMGAGVDRAISGLGSFFSGNYPSEVGIPVILNSVVEEEKQQLIARSSRRYLERRRKTATAKQKAIDDSERITPSCAPMSAQPAYSLAEESEGGIMGASDSDAHKTTGVRPARSRTETGNTYPDRSAEYNTGGSDAVSVSGSANAEASVVLPLSSAEVNKNTRASSTSTDVGSDWGAIKSSENLPGVLSRSLSPSQNQQTTSASHVLHKSQVAKIPVSEANAQANPTGSSSPPSVNLSVLSSRDEIREQAFLAAEARRNQNKL